MKKLGAIFMVTVFALAGVGVSYAGFFDIINVHGEVSTAYVDYEFVDWSGTWVWKDITYNNEIDGYQGIYTLGSEPPNALAWAKAMPGDAGTDYEVEVEFYNIFPLEAGYAPFVRWEADFYLHYLGSIPAYFYPTLTPSPELPDDIVFGWEAYDDTGAVIDWPIQLHYCDVIRVVIWVNVIQPVVEDSPLEGIGWDKTIPEVTAPVGFTMDFELIQWNEEAYPFP